MLKHQPRAHKAHQAETGWAHTRSGTPPFPTVSDTASAVRSLLSRQPLPAPISPSGINTIAGGHNSPITVCGFVNAAVSQDACERPREQRVCGGKAS